MENPNYYAIIPAEVRYAKIKANAKLLYGEITALANKTGECYASNRYFSELYSVSEKQVSVWIKELVDNGFIVSRVEVENGNKRFIAINQKVMTYPPKGVEGSTPKGVHNNTSNNNTNNNMSFSEFWSAYPKFRDGIKSKTLGFYKSSDLTHEQIMQEVKILKRQNYTGIKQINYNRASERRMRDLTVTPKDSLIQILKEIVKIMKPQQIFVKNKELMDDFPDIDIKGMFKALDDDKLLKSIKAML